MLNDIFLNSIIVTIETLSYRKSIADKLISSSHGYKLKFGLKYSDTTLKQKLIKNQKSLIIFLIVIKCYYLFTRLLKKLVNLLRASSRSLTDAAYDNLKYPSPFFPKAEP